MKKHYSTPRFCVLLTFLLALSSLNSFAQNNSITGNIAGLNDTHLKLTGYDAFKDTLISETTTDGSGRFILNYPSDYTGSATLQAANGLSIIVLLSRESFEMTWENQQDIASLNFKHSPENEALYQGMVLHKETTAKLSGLQYLKKLYKNQRLGLINKEIYVQEKKLAQFSKKLPKESYGAYYLNLYNLLGNLNAQFNSDPGRLADLQTQFNSLNFSDNRLSTSGLLSPILDSYFQLLESHYNTDRIYSHATTSIHAVLKSLEANPNLQKETSEYLFHFLGKRKASVNTASLALQMLPKSNYQLKDETVSLLKP